MCGQLTKYRQKLEEIILSPVLENTSLFSLFIIFSPCCFVSFQLLFVSVFLRHDIVCFISAYEDCPFDITFLLFNLVVFNVLGVSLWSSIIVKILLWQLRFILVKRLYVKVASLFYIMIFSQLVRMAWI